MLHVLEKLMAKAIYYYVMYPSSASFFSTTAAKNGTKEE